MDASILSAIGNTPLVRLSRLERDVPGLELYGKLEASNPGGSVKDRAARHMVLEGLRTGALGPGTRLLDATSGNTGIAYAMLGAALGFPVTLCLPSSASPERKRILTAYGAELIYTDPMDGSDGAIVEARRRYAARQRARHGADLGATGIALARTGRSQAHGLGHRPGDLRRDAGRSRRRGVGRGRARMVLTLCDAGDRYLSEHFWDEGRGSAAAAHGDPRA